MPHARRCSLAFTAVALAVVTHTPPARSQTAAPARHTKVSLVTETDAVQPGRPLTVGVRLQMEPGWHTYWRNPGDSGLPTRVSWTLPPGFEAGEIRWPAPIRFASGPVVSYGYAGEVLLPVEIAVPAGLAGAQVQLGARVDWLECQEACLPGKAVLTVSLPVRKAARGGPEAAAFAEARRLLPRPAPGWRISAAAQGGAIVLSLAPPRNGALAGAYFYAITPRVLDYARPQPFARSGRVYRLQLPRDPNGSSSTRLAGVLVIEGPGGRQAFEIDVPLS